MVLVSVAMVVAGTVSSAVAAVATASTPAGSEKAAAAAAAATVTTSASPEDAAGPAADVMVNGWGDGAGYHVDVATGRSGYTWREMAVLRPDDIDDSAWTGYQCVSGDGKFAAVTVLPASSVNIAAARDHGAFAFSANLGTGAVKPVASGVALKYHSPGCGTADAAGFTVNPGDNQRTTQVLSVDLPTGKVEHTTTVDGQLTSVVPTADGPVGVMGTGLVRIPEQGGTAGRPVRLANTGGVPYDLRPAAGGGVDFALQRAADKSSLIMRERSGKLSTLGEGAHASLQLMQGRAGRALAVGATRVASGSGVRSIGTAPLPYGATNVSLDGGAVTGAGSKTPQSAPLVLATRSGKLLKRSAAKSTRRSATTLPNAVPAASPDSGGTAASRSAQRSALVSSSTTTAATTAVTAAATTTPKCAVDRLAEDKQVMQPGTAQVTWAIQMAEQGLLTGSSYARPADYANLGPASYSPNGDFAKIALEHPSSDTWDSVPRSVYEAIVAQESNYSQASWHALPGIPGGALVADYYGAGGLITSMDYSKADCGHGLGQVTTGMSAVDPAVQQTLSPYCYIDGNPLNGVDPTGLFGWGSITKFVHKHADVLNQINSWSTAAAGVFAVVSILCAVCDVVTGPLAALSAGVMIASQALPVIDGCDKYRTGHSCGNAIRYLTGDVAGTAVVGKAAKAIRLGTRGAPVEKTLENLRKICGGG